MWNISSAAGMFLGGLEEIAVRGSILLVTHVPVRKTAEGNLIDEQTARGIVQWCRHFGSVTYIGLAASETTSSTAWVNLAQHPETRNCHLDALPPGYRLPDMLRSYKAVRARLRQAIAEHDHLCFTIGGLIGDWPAIAALEARAQKREYTAWIDRVEPQIIRHALAGASLKRRLKWAVELPLMERFQRLVLSRSRTALLQGMDTYTYFARSAPDPHCIYDTHTTPADRIDAQELATKIARIKAGSPLQITYVGRAAAMKGTSDWLDTLTLLAERGVPFQARWIGDGPDHNTMRQRVQNSALRDKVELPGFEGNYSKILASLRNSDMLLFCHKTMESPRCLIEALVSGTPIVGYHSHYCAGLAERDGGASLVPRDDIHSLASNVEALHLDRQRLAQLVEQAAQAGRRYDEASIYEHRARLMGASP